MIQIAADRITQNKVYPSLAKLDAAPYTPEWRTFGEHWPYTVPAELINHFDNHHIAYDVYTVESAPCNSVYIVQFGWHDHAIDYFALLPEKVRERLRAREMILIFYYHEGDSVQSLKPWFSDACARNSLPADCYRFVSGNTAAANADLFAYFPDHELLYQHRNRHCDPTIIHGNKRPQSFLCLSRTHKWWRAAVVSDLLDKQLLNNSLWSYHLEHCGDRIEDCPIELDTLDIRRLLTPFLAGAPYACDSFSVNQQNDHHLHSADLYSNTYCSVVLETLFDVDGSGAAFLTEKTFKCLKHGHLFVIAGGPGSIAALRSLGYRTFDHAIDHSYDRIQDNTQRYLALRNEIARLNQTNLREVYQACLPDLLHNQQLFLAPKQDRLNSLLERLNLHYDQ